jgi:hypothetical protein
VLGEASKMKSSTTAALRLNIPTSPGFRIDFKDEQKFDLNNIERRTVTDFVLRAKRQRRDGRPALRRILFALFRFST